MSEYFDLVADDIPAGPDAFFEVLLRLINPADWHRLGIDPAPVDVATVRGWMARLMEQDFGLLERGAPSRLAGLLGYDDLESPLVRWSQQRRWLAAIRTVGNRELAGSYEKLFVALTGEAFRVFNPVEAVNLDPVDGSVGGVRTPIVRRGRWHYQAGFYKFYAHPPHGAEFWDGLAPPPEIAQQLSGWDNRVQSYEVQLAARIQAAEQATANSDYLHRRLQFTTKLGELSMAAGSRNETSAHRLQLQLDYLKYLKQLPNNQRQWSPVRPDFGEMRDSLSFTALARAGRLDLTLGGERVSIAPVPWSGLKSVDLELGVVGPVEYPTVIGLARATDLLPWGTATVTRYQVLTKPGPDIADLKRLAGKVVSKAQQWHDVNPYPQLHDWFVYHTNLEKKSPLGMRLFLELDRGSAGVHPTTGLPHMHPVDVVFGYLADSAGDPVPIGVASAAFPTEDGGTEVLYQVLANPSPTVADIGRHRRSAYASQARQAQRVQRGEGAAQLAHPRAARRHVLDQPPSASVQLCPAVVRGAGD